MSANGIQLTEHLLASILRISADGCLDDALAACRTSAVNAVCVDGVVDRCTKSACAGELAAYQAKVEQGGCVDDACAVRVAADEARAYAKCLLRAADDPSDVGGCYSGVRACWGEDTFCPNERALVSEP